jgi:hypothetical protein
MCEYRRKGCVMHDLEARAIIQEREREAKKHQTAHMAREARMLRRRRRLRSIANACMLIFRQFGVGVR